MQRRLERARDLRIVLPLCAALSLVSSGHGSAAEIARPQSYDSFVSVADPASLAEMIARERYLHLPPGRYLIDNPLVIRRSEPLFLHGGDRIHTRLIARNPGKPLLVIERAPLVSLAGLALESAPGSAVVDERVLRVRGPGPAVLEMQECVVREGVVEIQAPGNHQIQAVTFFPRGATRAPLVLDHPGAGLVVVGGNISNLKNPSRLDTAQMYHVWQKRGRLRIYALGVQAALGPADFRIDTASALGAHVIAGVRSEGGNGANRGEHRAMLLRVPASDEPVDVVLEANSGTWFNLGPGRARLVDYNAAGTLWLIGNNAHAAAESLAVGQAPKATVVALGNLAYGGSELLPIVAARKLAAANLFNHHLRTGTKERPLHRLVPARPLPPPGTLPAVPEVAIPPPLRRPTLTRALPGMLDVRSFGAQGDGRTDDTSSLQAALDAACDEKHGPLVFLPPGTYRTTRALRLNHRQSACRSHAPGGWLAGAGRDLSIIARDATLPGSVFETEGLVYATIQGITFRGTPFEAAGAEANRDATFSMEYVPEAGRPTQGIVFDDVAFVGGRYALGIGLRSRLQCSENLIVESELRDAHYGLAVGSYNALANLVYESHFVDNDITMGHDETKYTGGTWTVLGATVTGTRELELAVQASASATLYLHGLRSDSPVLLETPVTGATFPIIFERSTFRPRDGGEGRIDFSASGGPIFLHSTVSRLRMRLHSRFTSNYALDLHSRIPDWGRSSAGPNSRILSWGEP